MSTIRTFIAIELPEPLREKIRGIQNSLRRDKDQIRWVDPEKIHVTLKFLGHIEEELIERIASIVERVTADFAPFNVLLKGIGAFPSVRNPKVIWLAISDKEDILKGMQKKIEEGLSTLDLKEEKKDFIPHFTLGRVKSVLYKKDFSQRLEGLEDSPLGTMRVDGLFLFRSDLKPQGPNYTKLRYFPLKEKQKGK